jgi:competence protein ComEA
MRTTLVIAAALVLSAFTAPALAQDPPVPTQSTAAASNAKPAKAAPAPASVNLNTATAKELEALPGVGPATAARILEYRQKQGGFKKIEDLMNVRGIGEKIFLNLKPLIVVTAAKGEGW